MLKDSYNRVHDYLRISITGKCNFRCTYCMPYDLPHGFFASSQKMTAEEIDEIVNVFVQLGVKKIRLTGGEPLLRKDAKEIIYRLSKYPVELAITTNGVLIGEYEDVFDKAVIQSVNVSLDTLKREKFFLITKRDSFHLVLKNIYRLLDDGFQVKINVVVMKGVNENELSDFVRWTKNFPLHVRFIEFMPFTGNRWSREKVYSSHEILEDIGTEFSCIRLADEKHSTAKTYKVLGHTGTFGVINTLSSPFCGDCNRMRLTADGKLRNCLFSKSETDLLTALRKGEDIVPLIMQCVKAKNAERGGQFILEYKDMDAARIENRSMVAIGG
ncbi:MAG TPA: GTP 3',8-cyclase MoaA [Bacteroidia bacterium]|nr:GTP 3',8-cyclase MoaA [Bacteroidia bacterium]